MKGGVSLLMKFHSFINQTALQAKGHATMSTIGPKSSKLKRDQISAFEDSATILDQICRQGAQRMLQEALEAEVDEFINRFRTRTTEAGRQRVIRNGHQPARTLLTGAGPVSVKRPRVRDMEPDKEGSIRFSSSILPTYLRRAKAIDELIPWLYLKGVSTGDFSEALCALLGPSCKNLSKDTVMRLKDKWSKEYDVWNRRDLSGKEYVYVWADGIHFNIRLEEHRQCILVIMGATVDGKKELIAIKDGVRESEQSWHEIFVELKQRGLEKAPKLAVGDGALGFWAALRKDWPETIEQRCWVHKTANVLNKVPKSIQGRVKSALHEIWQAATAEEAGVAFDSFLLKYEAKYPKATKCLSKDRSVLLNFYNFPAEHWLHVRSTNAIESVFATVRLRHRRTKGSGTARACLAMVFKLCQSAAKRWKKLNGYQLVFHVSNGAKFKDGERVAA